LDESNFARCSVAAAAGECNGQIERCFSGYLQNTQSNRKNADSCGLPFEAMLRLTR
jgi:hypothetical protein